MFNENESVKDLLSKEEKEIKETNPSFLQSKVSPSKTYGDYLKTGQPLLLTKAKQERDFLQETNKDTGFRDSALAGSLLAIGGLASPRGRKQVGQKITQPIFQGLKNLTTKITEQLKGRTQTSKQFIEDLTKRPDIREPERKVIRGVLNEYDNQVPVQEFASKVEANLMPLETKRVIPRHQQASLRSEEPLNIGFGEPGVETRSWDPVLRYEEVIFKSPSTLGNRTTHFPGVTNYFGHARGDGIMKNGKKIWREQEIQSDLLQKNTIEQAIKESIPYQKDGSSPQLFRRSIEQLQPFTNDRYGERIIRERIKEKANKGFDNYRFPDGKTIGKIQGHETRGQWRIFNTVRGRQAYRQLTHHELKVGEVVNDRNSDWVITDVLGNGRFKAIPKDVVTDQQGIVQLERALNQEKESVLRASETFDLAGQSSPQAIRYNNWGKWLKNNFNAKKVTDEQGNDWFEVSNLQELKDKPVLAFGGIDPDTLLAGAGITGLGVGIGEGLNRLFPESGGSNEVPIDNQEIPQDFLGQQEETQEMDKITSDLLETPVRQESQGIRQEIREGIIQAETGHIPDEEEKYKTIGVTGDLGKYQVEPKTLAEWGEPWLGRKYTPEEFLNDPKAQEEFFEQFLDVAERLELTPHEAGIVWHNGWGVLGSGKPREERDSLFRDYLEDIRDTPKSRRYLDLFEKNEKNRN